MRKLLMPIYLLSTFAGICLGFFIFKSIPIFFAILSGIGLGELVGTLLCVVIGFLSYKKTEKE